MASKDLDLSVQAFRLGNRDPKSPVSILTRDALDLIQKALIAYEFRAPDQVINDQKRWLKNGKLHRGCDLPAVDGPLESAWYKNGLLHREDRPAKIVRSGDELSKEWYKDGKLHRDDGPAKVTFFEGEIASVKWYQNGKLHRTDGPAKVYYINPENQEIGRYQNELWYENGVRHRIGGPAVYMQNGEVEEWWVHGRLHRENGPAVIWQSHVEEWVNGVRMKDFETESEDGYDAYGDEFPYYEW